MQQSTFRTRGKTNDRRPRLKLQAPQTRTSEEADALLDHLPNISNQENYSFASNSPCDADGWPKKLFSTENHRQSSTSMSKSCQSTTLRPFHYLQPQIHPSANFFRPVNHLPPFIQPFPQYEWNQPASIDEEIELAIDSMRDCLRVYTVRTMAMKFPQTHPSKEPSNTSTAELAAVTEQNNRMHLEISNLAEAADLERMAYKRELQQASATIAHLRRRVEELEGVRDGFRKSEEQHPKPPQGEPLRSTATPSPTFFRSCQPPSLERETSSDEEDFNAKRRELKGLRNLNF